MKTLRIFEHRTLVVVSFGVLLWLTAPHLFAQSKQEVYDRINQVRVESGSKPLSIDSKLEHSAQSWALFMPYEGKHNTRFTTRFKRGGGECIAWGEDPVAGWLNSSGHRHIMLAAEATAMGLGYWRGKWILRTFTKK